MENLNNPLQNPECPENEICKNEMKRKRIKTKSGKPLSKWHVSRLRILEDESDYGSFIQFIKWMGGNVPKEDFDDENEYLWELRKEFESLGGYEFFEEHNLLLPPCGVSIENTFFD